ncbi:hypothetical protein WOSG25_041630 [Weissella oryzae SG25]|uniref:YopX protein domain-containing protein n=1 Tax=Weissella oryzae (strain DSM 25784 / JCM 18191 / LMG 30913 / SG25) TaxID=1329250 RepID=A0A069CTJ0_WEIOS|nr:YopX family protein [Weissella oryzae]GAK30722.1 hypothetical protein WOSG25_041630 [Weissella oryzae SG25]
MAQREIKFRAWLIKDEIFLDDFMLNSQGMMYVIDYWGKKPYYVDPDDRILEQYTGLKDKNGVEIYEGDIVSASIYGLIEKGVVEYSQFGEWVVGNIRLNQVIANVIGNIHENPELLEAE